MADDALEILGISRAAVASDGSTVTLSLVDVGNTEYDIALSFDRLGQTIVKLLATAETAKAQRVADGTDPPTPDLPGGALMPYPLVRYSLGLSEDGVEAVLRVVSDNDLVWDYRLPMEALSRLRADIERLEAMPRAIEADKEE